MKPTLRLATAVCAVLCGCNTPNAVSTVTDPAAISAQTAAELSTKHLRERGFIGDVSTKDLTLVRASVIDKRGEGHARVSQTVRGVPVFGAEAVVHLKADGSLKGLTDGLVHGLAVDGTTPTLTAERAVWDWPLAAQGGWEGLSTHPEADLQLVKGERGHVLTWRVRLRHSAGARARMPVVFIDAGPGAVVWSYDNLQTAKNRLLHTLNHGSALPGTVARTEGQADAGDVDVDTNDRLGSTYDCYQALFGRDSFDNAGAQLRSSVHYSTNYVNAYWNGTQMVYGDGDNVNSRSLALSMDVTAHELTHAVTERSSALVYSGESGGLNEAMSDIFGEICEWHRDNAGDITGPTSSNTWMVGEDIWLASPALRYLDDPARDGTSLDFWTSTSGNVDVHYSSGIADLSSTCSPTAGRTPVASRPPASQASAFTTRRKSITEPTRST